MIAPRICCLDLDTFFVSVERLLDPRLRGKPVVVGGWRGGRGVVTSASYEVRAFGVRSGMSIREASERAPADAVFVPGHGEEYTDYSRRAHRIVLELYREARTRPLPIRLLGVALARLRPDTAQLALFDDDERRGVAVDRVREKFGYDAVHLATTLGQRHRRGDGGRAGAVRAPASGGPQLQRTRRRAQQSGRRLVCASARITMLSSAI